MSTLSRWLALFFVLVTFVVAAALYDRLPDPVPIHFDWHGRADGWMRKPMGALLGPLIMLGIFLFFSVTRAVTASPYSKASVRVGDVIHVALQAFLCEVNVVVLLVASGHALSINRAVLGGLGIFFVVLGNYFGKIRRNHLIGIRTPWTLSDDENWLLTHRLGGPVFMLGGAVLTLGALSGAPSSFLWVVLTVTVLVPTAYSYLLSVKGKAAR